MKKSLLILLTIFCFACSSNDDDNPCGNLSTDGLEITENLISTALSYFGDPTNTTCLEYLNAAEEYIDYSNSILNCLEADDRAELEQEIQELEADIAQLDCA